MRFKFVVREKLEQQLQQLKDKEDMELIREAIIENSLFPEGSDQKITLEELKKLIRLWKLHESRGFWKTHANFSDLVSVLLEYIDQQRQRKRNHDMAHLHPSPPAKTLHPFADPTMFISMVDGRISSNPDPVSPRKLKTQLFSHTNAGFKDPESLVYYSRIRQSIPMTKSLLLPSEHADMKSQGAEDGSVGEFSSAESKAVASFVLPASDGDITRKINECFAFLEHSSSSSPEFILSHGGMRFIQDISTHTNPDVCLYSLAIIRNLSSDAAACDAMISGDVYSCIWNAFLTITTSSSHNRTPSQPQDESQALIDSEDKMDKRVAWPKRPAAPKPRMRDGESTGRKKRLEANFESSPLAVEAHQHIAVSLVHFSVNLDENRVLSSPVIGKLLTRLFQDCSHNILILLVIFLNNSLQSVERQQLSTMIFFLARRIMRNADLQRMTEGGTPDATDRTMSYMQVLMTSIKSCTSFSMIRSHVFEYFFDEIILECLRISNEEVAKPTVTKFSLECAIRIESTISECLFLVSSSDTLQSLIIHRGLEMICKLHDLSRCIKACYSLSSTSPTACMKLTDFFLVELFSVFVLSEDIREQAMANKCLDRLLNIGIEYMDSIDVNFGHINGVLKAIGILGSNAAQTQVFQPKAAPVTNNGKMVFSKTGRRTKTVTLSDSHTGAATSVNRQSSLSSDGEKKQFFGDAKRDQLAKVIQSFLSSPSAVKFTMDALRAGCDRQTDSQCLRVVALSLAVLRVLCLIPSNATLLKDSVSDLCHCLTISVTNFSSHPKVMEIICSIRNLAAICLKGMTRSIMLAEFIGSNEVYRAALIQCMTDPSTRVMVSTCETICAVARVSVSVCRELWQSGFVSQATNAVCQTVSRCEEKAKIVFDDAERMSGDVNSKKSLDSMTISRIQQESTTLSGTIPTIMSGLVYSCKIFQSCSDVQLSELLDSLKIIVGMILYHIQLKKESSEECNSSSANLNLFSPLVVDDICHIFSILCSTPHIREVRLVDAVELAQSIISIATGNRSMQCMAMVIWFLSLSICASNSSIFLTDLVIPRWVIMAMRGGHDKTQVFCARAMLNMSYSEEISTILTNTDIVHDFVVVALLRTNNDEVKSICSQSFFNFLCHDTIRASVTDTGSVKAITKFSGLESDTIKTTCLSMIFNLASEASSFLSLLRGCNVFSVLTDLCVLPILQDKCITTSELIISKLLLGNEIAVASKKKPKDSIMESIHSNEWLSIIQLLEKIDISLLSTEKLLKISVWLYYFSVQLDSHLLVQILSSMDVLGLLLRIMVADNCAIRSKLILSLALNKILTISAGIKLHIVDAAAVDLISSFLALPEMFLTEYNYDDFEDVNSVHRSQTKTRTVLDMTLCSLHVMCIKHADRKSISDRDEVLRSSFCRSLKPTDAVSVWTSIAILSQMLPLSADESLPHFFRDPIIATEVIDSISSNTCEVLCNQKRLAQIGLHNMNSAEGIASLFQSVLILLSRHASRMNVSVRTVTSVMRLCLVCISLNLNSHEYYKLSLKIILLSSRIFRLLSLNSRTCLDIIENIDILRQVVQKLVGIAPIVALDSDTTSSSLSMWFEECCWDLSHVFIRLSCCIMEQDVSRVEAFVLMICDIQSMTRSKNTSNIFANCIFRLHLPPSICYSENGQKLSSLIRHAEHDGFTRAFAEQIAHGWDVEEPQLESITSAGIETGSLSHTESDSDIVSRCMHGVSRFLTKFPLSPYTLENDASPRQDLCERSSEWFDKVVTVIFPSKVELNLEDLLRLSLSSDISAQWLPSKDSSSILEAVDSAIFAIITTSVDSGRSRRPDSRGSLMMAMTGPASVFLGLIPDEASRKVLMEIGIGRPIVSSVKYSKVQFKVECVGQLSTISSASEVFASPYPHIEANLSVQKLKVRASALAAGDFRDVIEAMNLNTDLN